MTNITKTNIKMMSHFINVKNPRWFFQRPHILLISHLLLGVTLSVMHTLKTLFYEYAFSLYWKGVGRRLCALELNNTHSVLGIGDLQDASEILFFVWVVTLMNCAEL